ncbi:MAG TPA: FAD-dependent oxidoreductase [Spirochaetota bacterium]|nr:FAD-dependent oxidoreductase [Spirochaetota bacterium]
MHNGIGLQHGKNKKTGAVLVQGGGIAGVQASLDLANSGFKVHLVESSSAIGGMMAHLDKTFPTGDCATCIVSPKLVECSRNLNIEIHTLSELDTLEGEAGNFTAKVKKSPRYIDEKICNDCGDCTKACPVEVSDRFNRGLGKRKAVQKYNAQAIPNKPAILKLGHAPCKVTCPANINVQGYIQLIKKGEYVKAVNLIRERNPLSAICGRVCPAPCEGACTRSSFDSAVAIRQLKRFASDREMELVKSGKLSLPEEKIPVADAKKIAVVGAGPAGLTCAADLADRGFAVTVFEKGERAGGMLIWGIPEYRLPRDILDYEVELIRRKGVNFVYNYRAGKDASISDIKKGYDAVFISAGAHGGRKLGVEGEDLKGVDSGVEFLRENGTSGSKPHAGENVVVIGGGNVAVDVARTALRLGAKSVELVSLEKHGEMPAYEDEIKATLDEGIIIRNGWGPNRIIGSGSVSAIELKECTQVFDENRKFKPLYNTKNLTTIKADQVIVAIGQMVEADLLTNSCIDTEFGCLVADDVTLQTAEHGVFAGGDNVTGPASVIEAVASGKRAAESIERFVNGKDMFTNRFESSIKPVPEDLLPDASDVVMKERAAAVELPVKDRILNFKEVESAFSIEQAISEAERCLNCAICSECNECVSACEKQAVRHDMKEEITGLDVGSVILTPGFKEFDAAGKGEFGYGRYRNVVTSVQFERMLSAAGPFGGHVLRLSDGKEAKRIAFIQCVGSRDSKCGNGYCSSICCMATTKQALVADEHITGMKASIFYMDIRAYGKDFDQYYERARSKDNIEYIKSIPSRAMQMPGSMDIRLRYMDENFQYTESDFDLLVLAVGMEPESETAENMKRLGIELNEYGFAGRSRLTPLETSRHGVFIAGSFQEPKDIPETVTQASAAASMSMELLNQVRNTLTFGKTYPAEHDITDEEPRIGVFVCHCGINIASTVDVERVTAAVGGEPGVVIATHTMYTCSDSSLTNIKKCIKENRLNRVVVASCTPRTHEDLFRDTLREAGLNQYLFELANIRDQCSWVHNSEPELATEKAIQLVKMSIARSRKLKPLIGESLVINQSGLVIGGGLSGMTAALSLAEQGFKVSLIEKGAMLGGNLRNIYSTLENEDISTFMSEITSRIENHKNIQIYLDSEVAKLNGHIGKFVATVNRKGAANGRGMELNCGAIVVATGGEPAVTADFLSGKSENIITQLELEKRLHEKSFTGKEKNIVMIQCAGSRNSERHYCSRICCSMAVKNAIRIKKESPDSNIYVLYRDIRTYGFREKYYLEARKAGVVFIRYDEKNPPAVSGDSKLAVKVKSPDIRDMVEIEADNVVLSTGIDAPAGNRKMSDMLKLQLNGDGFFLEAHVKLRPVDFATEGIYLCGLAHSPKMIDENISQARAAASRAATVLSKTSLEVGAVVSEVNQDKCISCMTCVHACPYGAPFANADGKGEIAAAKCMGCGICASECPARAIQLNHFETEQFSVMLENLLEGLKLESSAPQTPRRGA